MLPNNGPLAVFPYETDPCTTAKYDVTFNNGMLTRRDIERPSEVLGCLRVPLEILEAIISLPTEILQLKVDYSSKEEELLEQQKATIDALNTLKEVQGSSGKVENGTIE